MFANIDRIPKGRMPKGPPTDKRNRQENDNQLKRLREDFLYDSAGHGYDRKSYIGGKLIGPQFLPKEKRAMAEVKLMHNSMSCASMDILNIGSLSYVLSPFSSFPASPSISHPLL